MSMSSTKDTTSRHAGRFEVVGSSEHHELRMPPHGDGRRATDAGRFRAQPQGPPGR